LVRLRVEDIHLEAESFECSARQQEADVLSGPKHRQALMVYLRKAKLPAKAPLFPSTDEHSEAMTRSGLLNLVKRLARQAGVSARRINCVERLLTSMLEAGAILFPCATCWAIPTFK
jgi:site-specific recombinase XerD